VSLLALSKQRAAHLMREQASEFVFARQRQIVSSLGLYDVPAVKMRQDELNGGNFNKVFFGGLAANWRLVAGKKDKARRYLRWAALNDRRAAEAYNGDLKTLFLQIAAQYRNLAEQIADPEQWQAKHDGRPK
jgi:hypothetical protein